MHFNVLLGKDRKKKQRKLSKGTWEGKRITAASSLSLPLSRRPRTPPSSPILALIAPHNLTTFSLSHHRVTRLLYAPRIAYAIVLLDSDFWLLHCFAFGVENTCRGLVTLTLYVRLIVSHGDCTSPGDCSVLLQFNLVADRMNWPTCFVPLRILSVGCSACLPLPLFCRGSYTLTCYFSRSCSTANDCRAFAVSDFSNLQLFVLNIDVTYR